MGETQSVSRPHVLHVPVAKASASSQRRRYDEEVVSPSGWERRRPSTLRPVANLQGDVRQFFSLDQQIGRGTYGYVFRASRLDAPPSERGRLAVKSVSKLEAEDMPGGLALPEKLRVAQRRGLDRLAQEIETLKLLCHDNIVSLVDTCEDPGTVCIIMEFCEGGEIVDHIVELGTVTEKIVAMIMGQVLDAVCYFHGKRVCHRDLKPENLLFASRTPVETNRVKVCDFGVACSIAPGEMLRLPVGTAEYVAPQVLAGRYDSKCDLWSCGVTLYKLLCGYCPFRHEKEDVHFFLIRQGNYAFRPEDWQGVSEGARALIRLLLRMEPEARASAEQALSHEWCRSCAPDASGAPLLKCLYNLRNSKSVAHVNWANNAKALSSSYASECSTATRTTSRQRSPSKSHTEQLDGSMMDIRALIPLLSCNCGTVMVDQDLSPRPGIK